MHQCQRASLLMIFAPAFWSIQKQQGNFEVCLHEEIISSDILRNQKKKEKKTQTTPPKKTQTNF